MKKEILLVILQSDKEYVSQRRFEHLGVGYLTSALRKAGFIVTIIDQNLTGDNLETIIQKTVRIAPGMIGLSCYQDSFLPMNNYISAVKQRLARVHITLGGIFATNNYSLILPEIPLLDSLVLGEGEKTVVQLAKAVFDNQKSWQSHPHITYLDDPRQGQKGPYYEMELDELEPPSRDTLPMALEQGTSPLMLASRGCYGNCTYCSITISNRKRRCRDLYAVIDEMEKLQAQFGVTHIQFVDDTFIGGSRQDQERIKRFAQELIRRKLGLTFSIECRTTEVDLELMRLLKTAGLKTVFLGVESGYQPTLDLFQKNATVQDNEQAVQILQKLKIQHKIGFIMFHPYTTLEEIGKNIEFLFKTDQKNLLNSLKNMLQVFPNSKITAKIRQDGRLQGPWYGHTYTFPSREIDAIYQFIIKFYLEIYPELERLSGRFRHVAPDEAQKMALINKQICSLFIQKILDYVKEPNSQLLKEGSKELAELNKEVQRL